MKLFQKLENEMNIVPSGVRAPYYFRYLGYREEPLATPSIVRANATYSLFANTKPHIFIHDLIAGNTNSLWVEENPVVLQYAKEIDAQYGKRGFTRNSDHYPQPFLS